MKKTKIYDITTRALMVVLALVMGTILLRFGVRTVFVKGLGLQGRTIHAVFFDAPDLYELPARPAEPAPAEEEPPAAQPDDEPAAPAEPVRDRDGIIWSTVIDWSELYPFRESGESEPEPPKTGPAWAFARLVDRIDALVAPFEARIAALEKSVDMYTSDYVVFYGKMVETANRYDKLIGWEIAGADDYNPVIELDGNYFIACTQLRDMTARTNAISGMHASMQAMGMEHFYVETGSKVCYADDDAYGIVNFSNQNADSLLKNLAARGVDALDLREKLHEDGLDHHAAFFRTDHHWKPETGLWAAHEIAEKLNKDYGFEIDLSLLDPANFRADVYEDIFLGSQGKKVTLARATPESISLLYPTYDVDLSIDIPSLAVEKRGDFSVIYRYDPVDGVDYYGKNPYAAYFYADNALTHLVNHNVDDGGKKILILGHSFDNCVVPFLGLGISHVDSMDLRNFNGDLGVYLEQNHYDVVIECYTTE